MPTFSMNFVDYCLRHVMAIGVIKDYRFYILLIIFVGYWASSLVVITMVWASTLCG